jgi:hypothetical protein
MSKESTLDKLIEEASSKYNVSPKLLEEIISLERARLYLNLTSRTSVLKRIREMIQKEVK